MINVSPNVGMEPLLDALKNDILSAAFEEVLMLEHARHAERIQYRKVEYCYTEDMDTLDGYPACELIGLTIRRDSDDDPMLTYEVSCQWTVNGANEQVMGREIKRLAAATFRFFDGRSLNPFIGGSPVRVGTVDFGPVVQARNVVEQRPWIKSADVPLFIDGVAA